MTRTRKVYVDMSKSFQQLKTHLVSFSIMKLEGLDRLAKGVLIFTCPVGLQKA